MIKLNILRLKYGDETVLNLMKFFRIITLVLIMCMMSLMGVLSARVYIYTANNQYDLGTVKAVGGRVNMLIMATDKHTKTLTDTILFASINTKTNKISVISIPRDTRVNINGRNAKINSAYGGNNHQRAIEKVTEIIGLPVNYYAVISPDIFKNIVDVLGGVSINVPDRMYYVDPYQDLYIDLYPGPQILDGAKAEQFCRFRSHPLGDVYRVKNQQMFIEELFKQKLNAANIDKIDDIYTEVISSVKTNIDVTDLTSLMSVLKAMTGDSMETYLLPGVPSSTSSDYIHDQEATNTLVNEILVSR